MAMAQITPRYTGYHMIDCVYQKGHTIVRKYHRTCYNKKKCTSELKIVATLVHLKNSIYNNTIFLENYFFTYIYIYIYIYIYKKTLTQYNEKFQSNYSK